MSAISPMKAPINSVIAITNRGHNKSKYIIVKMLYMVK